MIIDLLQNVALLVSLAVGLQILSRKFDRHSVSYRLAQGLLFGVVGIAGMLTPFRFAPGIIYDGRSIILALAGLFGGPVTALSAGIICAAYRVWLGGPGAIAGISVIVESAALGTALHYLRRRSERWVSSVNLLAFGIVVHVVMLALQLLIPGGAGREAFRQIGLIVLLLYPVGFFLAAQVFLESERKLKSDRALRESEDRYRSLFERNHAVMLITDPGNGQIIDANAAAEAFYGWPRNQLRSMHINAINTAPVTELEKGADAFGAPRSRDRVRHRLADGSVRDVEMFSGRIQIAGKPLQYSIIHDITERIQAEEARRKSEEFQQAMVACSPVALFSIDPEGAVTSWNPSAEKIFGWTVAEVLGKPLPIVPEDKQIEFARIRKCVLDGQTFANLEVIRRRKDGTLFNASLSTAMIRDEQGRIIGVMAAMQDITERKQAEEEQERLRGQLTQAQKLESIGRLAGGVAHDFNNMLGVILGHTELAQTQIDSAHPAFAELEEVRMAAKRSADLTRQLLAFARKQTIAPKVLDLNEVIGGLLNILSRLIGEDISLVWEPADGLWSISMDPSQVDQILTNLCVNARDAIDAAGTVTIRTENIALGESDCADRVGFYPGEFVRLLIADDGAGMDRETLSRIFDPFFTTKPQGKGTGLGLATVYGIVQQNAGFIEVHSAPGRGASFAVYLPRCAREESASEPGPSARPATDGHETILLVEDEPMTLALCKRVLEQLGYTVLSSGSPGKAVDMAGAHRGPIHLLVTDVVMPEMNGRDLARRLQAEHPGLKVLFTSGYTANVIAHHGVLENGVQFISKPFSMRDFAARVRQSLET